MISCSTYAYPQKVKDGKAKGLTVTVGDFGKYAAGLPDYFKMMRPVQGYLDDRAYKKGISKSELDKAIAQMSLAHDSVARNKRDVAIALCRMLVSAGRFNEALTLIEDKIEREREWYSDNVAERDDWAMMSYDAGAEIEKWIMRALVYDISENLEDARKAYDDAITFIEKKIEKADVKKKSDDSHFHNQTRQYYDIMQVLANNGNITNGTKLNQDERNRLKRERNLVAKTDMIRDFVKQNKIDDATVVQDLKRLDKLREDMLFGSSNADDTLKLYGIKSLLVGLRDGRDAELAYLRSMEGNSATGTQLKRYMKKIEKRLMDNDMPLHETVVRILAGYAPVFADDTPEAEKKTVWQTLDTARRRLEKTYPLQWMRR